MSTQEQTPETISPQLKYYRNNKALKIKEALQNGAKKRYKLSEVNSKVYVNCNEILKILRDNNMNCFGHDEEINMKCKEIIDLLKKDAPKDKMSGSELFQIIKGLKKFLVNNKK